MRGLEIDRVIIAVEDIEAAKESYAELLGLEFGETLEGHTNPDAGQQNLHYTYGHPGVEFITPTEDNHVRKFLDENGPGMYGTVFRVADLEEAVAELEEKGVEPIDLVDWLPYSPEAIYHPDDFGGVLTILTEYRHPVEMH